MEYLIDFSQITLKHLDQLDQYIRTQTTKSFDQIAGLEYSQLSYQTCFGSRLEILEELDRKTYVLNLGYNIADQKLRDKIKQINKSLVEFNAIQTKRLDVYEKISTYYYQKFLFESPSLSKEQISHVERTFSDYRYSGIHMGQMMLDQEIQMKKQFNTYLQVITSNPLTISLKYDDLVGCDESIKRSCSNLILTISTFNHVLKYCTNQSTRKAVYIKYFEDIGSNSKTLEQIIRKRHELSNLFGFQSYSDLVLDTTMAGTKQRVMDFLTQMFEKYNPNQSIQQIKQITHLDQIELWDIKYYTEKIKNSKSNFQLEQIERLVDIDSLVTGIIQICEEIFGFVCEEITDSRLLFGPKTKIFKTIANGITLGYFYLDLFLAPYKTPGARVQILVPRSYKNLPIGSLTCNFRSKILFDNIVTLLHEFGHMMHLMFTKSQIYSNGMYTVPRDYVEIPSKFMENWAYTAYGLERIVKPEYKHLITRDLVSKLYTHTNTLDSINQSVSLQKAWIDFELHSSKHSDHKKLIHELNKKFYGITNTPNEINVLATWVHLVGGYGSKFYSYLWSDEYAKKIFAKFKSSPNPKELGKYYITMLLEPGSLMDYSKSLENFLDLKV
jgi:Zn-dependent oligopeptidase